MRVLTRRCLSCSQWFRNCPRPSAFRALKAGHELIIRATTKWHVERRLKSGTSDTAANECVRYKTPLAQFAEKPNAHCMWHPNAKTLTIPDRIVSLEQRVENHIMCIPFRERPRRLVCGVIVCITMAAACRTMAQLAMPAPSPSAAVGVSVGESTHDRLVREYSSDDKAQIDKAETELRQSVLKGTFSAAADALDVLRAVKRFDEMGTLALEAILASPRDSLKIQVLVRARVTALAGMGKPVEALAAAKQYFNICSMAQTSDAILLLCDCLAAAHPPDADIARRFRQQQIYAALEKPPSPRPDALGKPILPTIAVDAGPYQKALADAEKLRGYARDTVSGNLLLLCDRAEEAVAAFKQAADEASDTQYPDAVENVARALRAQTGGVAAANAYLREQRGGS